MPAQTGVALVFRTYALDVEGHDEQCHPMWAVVINKDFGNSLGVV